MSCGQIALNKVGIKYDNYFASEIDKYCIKVTMANYPKTIQIGDVTNVKAGDLPKIGLLAGGSPCQGFSFAGKQLNFSDTRSKLFFEYVRLLKECKPKYFLLENVRMKKEYQDIISNHLKVEPVFIDSKDFTAGNRKRLYWTNIPINDWIKKNILLKDIINNDNINYYLKDITERYLAKKPCTLAFQKSRSQTVTLDNKHRCITTGGQGISNSGATNIYIQGRYYQAKSELIELLQGVPKGFTNKGISETQRHRMLGNGWTVDVIEHILKGIKCLL
jgi:DNA (cytosine-5)-methyltransferase 3A